MDKIDVELKEKLYLENTAYDFIMEFIDAFMFPNKPYDTFGCHAESCVKGCRKQAGEKQSDAYGR